MNASNPNLKFEYLYRDGGNYKTWGEIIFENPSGLNTEEATEKVRKLLISSEFFNPKIAGIERFDSLIFDPELDHEWYEFDQVSETSEEVTSHFSFDQFLKNWSASLPR